MKLQGRYVNVCRAHRDIESVKTALEAARSGVDTFHEHTFEEAARLGASVGIDESSPRLAGWQQTVAMYLLAHQRTTTSEILQFRF